MLWLCPTVSLKVFAPYRFCEAYPPSLPHGKSDMFAPCRVAAKLTVKSTLGPCLDTRHGNASEESIHCDTLAHRNRPRIRGSARCTLQGERIPSCVSAPQPTSHRSVVLCKGTCTLLAFPHRNRNYPSARCTLQGDLHPSCVSAPRPTLPQHRTLLREQLTPTPSPCPRVLFRTSKAESPLAPVNQVRLCLPTCIRVH